MARKTLTDRGVLALNPRPKLYEYPDPQMPGHYVRVWPSGKKSFSVLTRGPDGKQVRVTLGEHPITTVDEARDLAREAIKRIKAGEDRAGPQSFESVAENWFKRHANQLTSARKIRLTLDRCILPAWRGREFLTIGRGDVTKLLDHVEDNSGQVAADLVLSIVSRIFNFHATRHDNYTSPLVRGMRRSNPKERARDRILSDDEIRVLWNAADDAFGDLVKLLLLTGQRRDKVASMKWTDVSVDGVWTVANGNREKGTGGELKLPEMAIDILRARPRFASNPYVFPGRGSHHLTGFSARKAGLKVDLPQWGLHDLRRTARSLMARAGVRPDIAERVLGHAIKGVEGIYDRHSYREEKAHALRALAGLIENILRPQEAKVARLRG